MTLLEIKQHIMFQTGNDVDDLGDFLPHITNYINEGYDLLVSAWCGERVSPDSDNYPTLTNDKSQPETPEWTHRAIADWATWLIYRNGNAAKQQRGQYYRLSAESLFQQVRNMTNAQKGIESVNEASKTAKYIYNIPR